MLEQIKNIILNIVFEMYPNADVVAAMQISDVEAVVKAKVAQINEDLPLYKRIIKVIIRDEELKKPLQVKSNANINFASEGLL